MCCLAVTLPFHLINESPVSNCPRRLLSSFISLDTVARNWVNRVQRTTPALQNYRPAMFFRAVRKTDSLSRRLSAPTTKTQQHTICWALGISRGHLLLTHCVSGERRANCIHGFRLWTRAWAGHFYTK